MMGNKMDRFELVNMEPLKTETRHEQIKLIVKVIADMDHIELTDLRNTLVPAEVAHINEFNEYDVHLFSDIEAWGVSAGVSITNSGQGEYPFQFRVTGKLNHPGRFAQDRDALICAFNSVCIPIKKTELGIKWVDGVQVDGSSLNEAVENAIKRAKTFAKE
jgi:hypothetical protein